jgi:ADP-ribose pyrophosphatase
MNLPSPFETLSSEITWSSPWYHIESSQILLPNGRQTTYHVVKKAGAAFVVPVTGAGEIVLIHNYRYTVDDWCWEVPAGNIEPGASPQETAIAELREEVGGTAEAWHDLGQSYTMNGICDEMGHYFLATGVQLAEPEHEPVEVMQIHLKPIVEALEMLRDGSILDGQTLIALYRAEPLLKQMLDSMG